MLVLFQPINDDLILCTDLLDFLSEDKLQLSFLFGHILPLFLSLLVDIHLSSDNFFPFVSERLLQRFLVLGHTIVVSLHFLNDVL